MRQHKTFALLGAATLVSAAPAAAQPVTVEALSAELANARAQIAEQQRALDAQEARLKALEARIENATGDSPTAGTAIASASPGAPGVPGDLTGVQQVPVERVGQAPTELEMPQVAVLGDQGSIITRAGQLTGEAHLEYARADRNRAIFRGIEVVESVLIGVFDINESRQDVLTAATSLRYGLTNRLEFGVRVPYVYRSDKSVLAPVEGSTNNDAARTRDASANGNGIGDVEFSTRYQLTSARPGLPFLIANLQVVAPTGSSPFEVPRSDTGIALEAATGAGFWGVSPSLTAILPTDPAVLFGTLGYTHNFSDDVNTRIGDVIVEFVDPGDALSASIGLGVSLNQRTSFNLGYAHSWVFGTRTRTRAAEPGSFDGGPLSMTSRDLQLGRLLFGVTYRLTNRANLNWAVEVGATDDATDVRTVLRVPIVLLSGR